MSTTIRFDLTHADGRRESFLVSSERIVIGSAAHCDVRLAPDESAPEQAVVEWFAGTIRITARAASPEVRVDDRLLVEGASARGTSIKIGAMALELSFADGTANEPELATQARNAGNRALPTRIALGGAIAVVAALLWLDPAPPRTAERTAPDIWEVGAAACPTSNPNEARALAEAKVANAGARAQRHPFYLSEGVEAVSLFQIASVCFRVSGDAPRSEQVAEIARDLRERISADYRVRRLRLEYALKRKDVRTALEEAGMLRQLLAGRSGSYVDWLSALLRSSKADKETDS